MRTGSVPFVVWVAIVNYLPDSIVADAVATLIHEGHHVTRVEHRRRTLEQTFLALTEPAAPAAQRAESSVRTVAA